MKKEMLDRLAAELVVELEASLFERDNKGRELNIFSEPEVIIMKKFFVKAVMASFRDMELEILDLITGSHASH